MSIFSKGVSAAKGALESENGADIASSVGSAVNVAANKLIGGGMTDNAGGKIGAGISKIGNAAGSIVGKIPGVGKLAGPAIQAVSGIVGGLTTRMFGAKLNYDNISKINSANAALNLLTVDSSSTNNILDLFSKQNFGDSFNKRDVGKDGFFSNTAKNKFDILNTLRASARNRAYATYDNAIENNAIGKINNMMSNVFAYGGMMDGPIGYAFNNLYLNDKRDAAMNKGNLLALPNSFMNTFAGGGYLSTHGADFPTGVTAINNGGTHELNPYEGVPMGIAPDGGLNLVEEGEALWNDYVFSKRLTVPEEAAKNLHLYKKGGKISFADAAIKLSREAEERPNDPISQDGMNALLSILQLYQEEERMKKQAEEAQSMFNSLPPEDLVGLMQMLQQGIQLPTEQGILLGMEPGMEDPMQLQGMPQEMMLEQMPQDMMQELAVELDMPGQMMAFGGPLHKFEKGGNAEKIDKLQKLIDELQKLWENTLRGVGITKEELGDFEWSDDYDTNRKGLLQRINGAEGIIHNRKIEEEIRKRVQSKFNEAINPDSGTYVNHDGLFYNRQEVAKERKKLGENASNLDYGNLQGLTGDELKKILRENLDMSDFRYNTDWDIELPNKDTNNYDALGNILRYGNVATDLASVISTFTASPDYTHANLIERDALNTPTLQAPMLSNYMPSKYVDLDYQLNALNSLYGASNRGVANSANGNAANALMGYIGNNYIMGNQIGQMRNAAEAINYDRDKEKYTFNNSIDTANASNIMGLNNLYSTIYGTKLGALNNAANLRQTIYDKLLEARGTSLTSLGNNLSMIGKEKLFSNMINNNPYFDYGLDSSFNVKKTR